MRIKTWQKWFICCFATIFVAVFFVYDCLFFHIENNLADEIVIEDVIQEDLEEETEETQKPEQDSEQSKQEQQVEKIPNYTNGYTCLLDAYKRMSTITSYKTTMVSKCTSAGVTQNVKSIKQRCDNKYSTENFGYTESALGRVFYSRATTEDMETFDYIYTENIDSNFTYNLDGAEHRTVESLQEIQKLVGYNIFIPLTLIPTKTNGKLISFDRLSYKNYYIVKFSFNLDAIPESLIREMKLHSGASSVTHSSCVIEVQISKETGYIRRTSTTEVYKINVKGISLNVVSQASTLISNINEKFEFTY